MSSKDEIESQPTATQLSPGRELSPPRAAITSYIEMQLSPTRHCSFASLLAEAEREEAAAADSLVFQWSQADILVDEPSRETKGALAAAVRFPVKSPTPLSSIRGNLWVNFWCRSTIWYMCE